MAALAAAAPEPPSALSPPCSAAPLPPPGSRTAHSSTTSTSAPLRLGIRRWEPGAAPRAPAPAPAPEEAGDHDAPLRPAEDGEEGEGAWKGPSSYLRGDPFSPPPPAAYPPVPVSEQRTLRVAILGAPNAGESPPLPPIVICSASFCQCACLGPTPPPNAGPPPAAAPALLSPCSYLMPFLIIYHHPLLMCSYQCARLGPTVNPPPHCIRGRGHSLTSPHVPRRASAATNALRSPRALPPSLSLPPPHLPSPTRCAADPRPHSFDPHAPPLQHALRPVHGHTL